jgi:protein gp37
MSTDDGLTIQGRFFHIASNVEDWHNAGWDLVQGCTKVSAGCEHCSAAEVFARVGSPLARLEEDKPVWTGNIEVSWGALEALKDFDEYGPLRFFVCPWGDLFHKTVPDEYLEAVWDRILTRPQHTYVFLTKRAERMVEFMNARDLNDNIWLSVTVESDKQLDRARALLRTQAAVKAVSCEPLLEEVNLREYLGPDKINWVTAGPELGSFARHCKPDWMRRLRDDSKAAGVPFFTKHILDGHEYREIPE